MSESADNWVLYDGECPFCSAYMKLVRLKVTVGQMRLIDARSGGPEAERVKALGYDLNQGMILHLDGRIYHGDACMNRLALLSTPAGPFNRINRLVFSNAVVSAILYPALRLGRNCMLALLGIGKI